MTRWNILFKHDCSIIVGHVHPSTSDRWSEQSYSTDPPYHRQQTSHAHDTGSGSQSVYIRGAPVYDSPNWESSTGDYKDEILPPLDSQPVRQSKGPVALKGLDNLPGHKIVTLDKKTGMRCLYCQVHRVKTASGWRVKTSYKCETCNVPLCSSEVCERNCFRLHHIEMFGEGILDTNKK